MNISNATAKTICKYSLRKASSVERLKNAKVPMLFIHGTQDTFVPYNMIEKNIEAYSGPYKEVLRMKDATHGESLRRDLKLYIDTVQNLVSKYINN